MKKTRVFWYFWKKHYRDTKRVKLKIHFKGQQYLVDKIQCNVSCNTKSKKTNPVLVMEAKAVGVTFRTTKVNGYKFITAYIC